MRLKEKKQIIMTNCVWSAKIIKWIDCKPASCISCYFIW